MSAIKKNCVIVPVDFGDASFSAIDVALDYVEETRKVQVIHILEPLPPTEPAVLWDTIDNETRIQNLKENLTTRLNQPQYQGIQVIVRIGHVVEEIIDFSKESHADLIVIPTHGRRGINRFLLGSVAERVVRFADCPVLVLR
ncbi:MAG: universal stress protein [Microcoleaceae cyanobacterium]